MESFAAQLRAFQLREAFIQFGFSFGFGYCLILQRHTGYDCKDWQRSGEACGGSISLGAGTASGRNSSQWGVLVHPTNTADLGTKFHSGERLRELT